MMCVSLMEDGIVYDTIDDNSLRVDIDDGNTVDSCIGGSVMFVSILRVLATSSSIFYI